MWYFCDKCLFKDIVQVASYKDAVLTNIALWAVTTLFSFI